MADFDARQVETIVISRRVKAGLEVEFETLSERMTAAASRFDGYLGTSMFRPVNKEDPEYRIVFKFADRLSLEKWNRSSVRLTLITQMERLIVEETRLQSVEGIATWFQLDQPEPRNPVMPNKLRMTLVSWLALYPIVTAIFWLFGDQLAGFSLPVRTLLVTLVVMFTMSYIAMPRFTKWFHGWIFK